MVVANNSALALAERIKLHRIRRGETQEELADRLGVHRSTINKWENGGLPEELATLVQEMDADDDLEGNTYQLSLPFGDPMNLEVRIYPKKPDSIRLEVERKQKAS